MGKSELVFIPAPGIGHLVSTVEFAKTLIQHDHQMLITVFVIKASFTPVDEYIKSLTNSQLGINLIYLPEMDPPPLEHFVNSAESSVCAFIDSHIPHVKNILTRTMLARLSSADSVPVVGLIVDFFCLSMIDIADELGIPSFIFMTSGVAILNLMFYLPLYHEQNGEAFSLSDPELLIPGFQNPVPPSVLPEALLNKNGGYDAFVKLANRFKRVKGIIVNTFSELEPYGIQSFNEGNHPKVYLVGPLINQKEHPNPEMDSAERDKIMKWLDVQAESSVVFLCFGSGGSFSATQVTEIARGLEQSGHKFLWSMRLSSLSLEPDSQLTKPKEMLPEGFLDRVQGRGMICGWAPQVEILGHKAIGGFVSHCGWNSILESLWYGVPIAGLPMYAEQQLNAFTLVKELGLAVELKLDYRRNVELKMEEVEKGVTSVMDSENEVRKKVKEMSRICRMVGMEGGSSLNALFEFIRDIRGRNH